MKNPLMPFAAIMAGGIILVFVIAIYGATQGGEKAGGGEKAKQEEQGGTASADPEEIFQNNSCVTCHGQNLKGGSGGPDISKVGASLSQDEILDQVKNGGGGMPGDILNDAEAKKVAEWLSKKK